ncbi:activating signal cointegrator 1 complex subunit 3-like [Oncorhynchus mykiss]|uniref:activating signal cointegrator 1 complex subunit 3-like n=1 Tax=Oncorhynchus mykiss TaxID=8022 RepID=UPI001877FBB4|nr:activating signal cointegrator 1 complex subunit 3-like [Oncorhynchus mykiss]
MSSVWDVAVRCPFRVRHHGVTFDLGVGLFQVESTQSMIRILGLSATLPNFLDVDSFLHVNLYIGLFYFDSHFRPVPLGQSFVGIKTTNKIQQLHDMEEDCYEKVLEQIRNGHQVMVFVSLVMPR